MSSGSVVDHVKIINPKITSSPVRQELIVIFLQKSADVNVSSKDVFGHIYFDF